MMAPEPNGPGVITAVFTDGRVECITKTIHSYEANVTGAEGRRVIFDDSGDTTYAQWLGERFPGWAILSSARRQGFGGNIRRAWDLLQHGPERWVFHLEDDFTFDRPVDLRELRLVMASDPNLVQMALIRQPVNDAERRDGGLYPHLMQRGATERHTLDTWEGDPFDPPVQWITHRAWFTTNPSLYPTTLCRLGWPEGDESEGHFTHRLLEDPMVRFGYWGDGSQWVTHIGDERVGEGY